MEKITTDISSFESLRRDGYVYVDKTDLLWRLAANKVGRQGKCGLFSGLKIEKMRWDWKKPCPVVVFGMADANFRDTVNETLTWSTAGFVGAIAPTSRSCRDFGRDVLNSLRSSRQWRDSSDSITGSNDAIDDRQEEGL